jgi:hypothetical protein
LSATLLLSHRSNEVSRFVAVESRELAQVEFLPVHDNALAAKQCGPFLLTELQQQLAVI